MHQTHNGYHEGALSASLKDTREWSHLLNMLSQITYLSFLPSKEVLPVRYVDCSNAAGKACLALGTLST
jgi:hypothetical protein